MRDIRTLPDAQLRIFQRPDPPPPDRIRSVYLIGICGKGMGALAGLFRQAGYEVTGADEAVYPPMSTHLDEMGIPVYIGFAPAHLEPAPDLVIVGNACTPTHAEAAYAREHGLVQLSFPEALAHYFLRQRRSLVVGGTHGKTTTTGMMVHVFQEAGLDPGFLVGGVMENRNTSYGLGSGPHFIVEGDEYDSAYFDKRPKFLLYQPTSAIITSMEFDHADIYDDWDDYREAFRTFAGLVPDTGVLALNGDDPEVRALAESTKARVRFFGLKGHDDDVTAREIRVGASGQRFSLVLENHILGEVYLPMSGRHNLLNALAVCTIALEEGVPFEAIRRGFGTFKGMKRRQDVLGEANGVIVVDDFAHHPTAVRETIKSIIERYPERRVVAVFEPRSNSSRRKVFEQSYAEAFDLAEHVFISAPPLRHNDRAEDFLDAGRLAQNIRRRGIPAASYPSAADLLPDLQKTLEPGDVALVMSNGSFDNIHHDLLARLQQTERRSSGDGAGAGV